MLQVLSIAAHKVRLKTGITDGAPWYNNVCRWLLRMPTLRYGTEWKKNLMERFIQHIRDRADQMF